MAASAVKSLCKRDKFCEVSYFKVFNETAKDQQYIDIATPYLKLVEIRFSNKFNMLYLYSVQGPDRHRENNAEAVKDTDEFFSKVGALCQVDILDINDSYTKNDEVQYASTEDFHEIFRR